MSYYIGMDGGGTKTKCVLCNENLEVIYETQSGPSNFLTIGTETVADTILDLIHDCINERNIPFDKINGIVLGTTGAGRESDALKLESAVYNLAMTNNFALRNFKVVSDARIALEGAFSGNSGSILIAGTGSIMFGKDNQGNIHRVGGFGRLIGDEGSGLTIGRKGLNIFSKFLDGRGKDSLLFKKIEDKYGISDQSQLIIKVYSDGISIQDIAPLVIESASNGDQLCNNILEEETNELLLHIAAMSKHLLDDKMKVVFIGGTITHDNFYSKMLNEKINTFLPKIKIQKPDFSPEIGAVIMAKQFQE